MEVTLLDLRLGENKQFSFCLVHWDTVLEPRARLEPEKPRCPEAGMQRPSMA